MTDLNTSLVNRWFREFWGSPWNPKVVDDLATADIIVRDGLRDPQRGRAAVVESMADFREAFPDLCFRLVGDLLADGNCVVARWTGGGTHTGAAFCDFRLGSLPASSGRKMQYTGISVFRVDGARVSEDKSQGDGLTAMQQLGLIRLPEATLPPPRLPLPPGWNRMPPRPKTC